MDRTAYLNHISEVISAGPYDDTWTSLTQHPSPHWLAESKFGIFIHWGIYSVPAYGNEWYPRTSYDPSQREYAYHLEHYGKHTEFGYKDFIPHFRGESFDAGKWIALFQNAGARYVVPVAEHHDGFAMYETELNRWNAKEMGPGRDVLRELKTAAEAAGLVFGASTHRAEHYFFMNMGRCFESDIDDPACADFYGPACYRKDLESFAVMDKTTHDPCSDGPDEAFLKDWMLRTCELIERCQPSVLYFDWWIHNYAFRPYLKKIAAFYYNLAAGWGKEVTIDYKDEAIPQGVGTPDIERGALTGISPIPWQADTAIGKKSWGYIRDNEYKTSRQIICDLIDIVSKNGSLLLNVGPKADGTITEEETKVLLEIGKWLGKNSEGIYGTSPWKVFGEGSVNAKEGFFMDGDEKPFAADDFRFTYKNGSVYAFQMRPDGRAARIRTFAMKHAHDVLVDQVELIGYGRVPFARDGEAMEIQMPEGVPCALPLCFRIELA